MKSLLFKLLGLSLLVGSLLVGWLWMYYQQFLEQPLTLGEAVILEIPPGRSVASLAAELEERGMIADARLFRWMLRVQGTADRIKAGEYRVLPGTTPPGLAEQLVAGKVVQYSLTLVEGWTFAQVRAALAAEASLEQTLTGLDDAAVMARLGHPDEHPEGRFFPDTYRFPRGTSDEEFLRRAYAAMAERLAREWEGREEGLPYKDPYEALIMASIVEKETGLPEERAQVAGVFVRRLRKGMRLQTDPTVIYGLGEAFDGNLTRRHLNGRDNRYNTYRIRGLPPTPIAMPGGEAIHAALHPADGSALYFVASGDGGHHFSDTLEEHNRAVVKYQLNGRKRPFSSSP